MRVNEPRERTPLRAWATTYIGFTVAALLAIGVADTIGVGHTWPLMYCCWRCGRWGTRQFTESHRSDRHGTWECSNDRACNQRASTNQTTPPPPAQTPKHPPMAN